MTIGIWREGLHQLLWEQRYGDDLVELNQATLAEQLQVTRGNLNKSIKIMVDKGWLDPVGAQVYRVTEPEI